MNALPDDATTPSEAKLDRDFHDRLRDFTPRSRTTSLLIAMNIAIFAGMIATGVDVLNPTVEDLVRWGADYGPRTTNGEWWRLFTSTFVHIGILHIAANMWVLSVIGRFVERLIGPTGLLLVYTTCGLAGSLVSVIWNPHIVSAGASGAVFGLYGALIGYLLRQRRGIPALALRALKNNALWFVGFNLLIGFSTAFINNAAHLGGLAGGIALGYVIARPVSIEGVALRWQALWHTGLASLLLLGSLFFFVERVTDIHTETAEAWRVFNEVDATYSSLVAKSEAGRLTDAAMGSEIESTILPPLRALNQRYPSIQSVPDHLRHFVSRVHRLILAHIDFYTALARAAPSRDTMLLEVAAEERRRVDELFEAFASEAALDSSGQK